MLARRRGQRDSRTAAAAHGAVAPLRQGGDHDGACTDSGNPSCGARRIARRRLLRRPDAHSEADSHRGADGHGSAGGHAHAQLEEEWAAVLEGAREEGEINIISGSSSVQQMPSFTAAFEEMTGGEVNFTELRAPDVVARLPEEYAAGPAQLGHRPARRQLRPLGGTRRGRRPRRPERDFRPARGHRRRQLDRRLRGHMARPGHPEVQDPPSQLWPVARCGLVGEP